MTLSAVVVSACNASQRTTIIAIIADFIIDISAIGPKRFNVALLHLFALVIQSVDIKLLLALQTARVIKVFHYAIALLGNIGNSAIAFAILASSIEQIGKRISCTILVSYTHLSFILQELTVCDFV